MLAASSQRSSSLSQANRLNNGRDARARRARDPDFFL
jgi:hypothetical protein